MLSRFPFAWPIPWLFAVALIAFWAPRSEGSDGVLEISHACAAGPGCFAGDGPGYPVTIDGAAGSSYRLTSDLTVPDENTTGVLIDGSFVTVDLGGHKVIGPVTCSGTPNVCSPTGTGGGVRVGVSGNRGVRIRNGTVTGMGDLGFAVNFTSVIEDVTASRNGGIGIFLGPGSRLERGLAETNGSVGISGLFFVQVKNSVAVENGGDGIVVGADSIVAANTVALNNLDGIEAGDRARVVGNNVSQSGEHGIHAGRAGTIEANVVSSSGDTGIFGDVDLVVRNNTVTFSGTDGIYMERGLVVENIVSDSSNEGIEFLVSGIARGNEVLGGTSGVVGGKAVAGNHVSLSSTNGIVTGPNAHVWNNTVEGNGFGIFVGADTAVRDNQIANNSGGTVGSSGTFVDLGGNACDGSSSCP